MIGTERDWCDHWSKAVARAGRDAFLAQVGYTINRRPLDPAQIDMIVDATAGRLALGASDRVLDLCCGNGLLSRRLAALVERVHGVDFSPPMIEVARERFAAPNVTYVCCPVTELTADLLDHDRITKITMAFALQYFTRDSLATLLDRARAVTGAPVPIYFTDVPDVDHLYDFYNTPERRADLERRRAAGTEAIGTWWQRQTLAELIGGFGYAVDIIDQDAARYAAHYRFDLLARPR